VTPRGLSGHDPISALRSKSGKGNPANMSGRRSREKGARVERAIVHALQAEGFAAARVPLSGAAGGRFAGDVVVPVAKGDALADL
jgi:hypothetical protein